MKNVKFTGAMSAFATPLYDDGRIREQTARELMRWQLGSGLKGFYICGGTGEGIMMKPEARKRLAEIAVEEAKGRGVVISHVGAADLPSAKELAAHAAAAGCDAISSVPPFFYQYGLSEISEYYEAIAEASGLPTLIYATPLAGTVFSRDMIAALMEIPGVIGLKWTSPDYYSMSKIKHLNGGDINVINGPDETLLCGLIMGADGGIGANYNIMPKVFAGIYDAFYSGDYKKACALQAKANRVIDIMLQFGVITGVKEALNLLGYDFGFCVPPIKQFNDEEKKAFYSRLQETGYPEEYI